MKKSLRILILNWRDPKHPSSGGAELLTHEIARRWARLGHQVTWFGSSFEGAKQFEKIDGVYFIRKGRWWSVHLFAFFYYQTSLKNKTDYIIDEVHWFPFFSALYAPSKTTALICEVANKLFYRIFPYPIALAWRSIEKFYLLLYKNVPAMVISPSTKKDLLKEGHISKNITVLPMGLTIPKGLKLQPKEKKPTIISLGRINKQKGIMDIIEAFHHIHQRFPECKFWIVGSGDPDYVAEVKQKVDEYNLTSATTFFGFVSDEKKYELLARAHLLIGASLQEGWGLTIPEAGLVKTPAVVYKTQGVQDVILHKKDGLLVKTTPKALAEGILSLVKDKAEYRKMQNEVYKKSSNYSWDDTAEVAMQTILRKKNT
jgi:glycosyltransferase involved in cell wall biosynthesis